MSFRGTQWRRISPRTQIRVFTAGDHVLFHTVSTSCSYEELRGRRHGHRLLMMAEDEERKRGAENAYLDTFSFQAPDFYKGHGYRVFGELQDFSPGHQRYFLTERL